MKSLLKYIFILLFLLCLSTGAQAQFVRQQTQSSEFFFDAVVFKSQDSLDGRVDVYAMIPYESLEFLKSDKVWGAKFSMVFHISDSAGNRAASKKIERTLAENDYFTAQGGTGAFETVNLSFYLPQGRYDIEALLTDNFSKKEFTRSRVINILDFDEFDFALSGLLLVSSIEESGGKYKITPHISDNVGMLKDGFFIFFESYNKTVRDSVLMMYEITGSGSEILKRSSPEKKSLTGRLQRHYMRIELPPDTKRGSYTLKAVALKPDASGEIEQDEILAIGQRSIKIYRTIAGAAVQDIDKAINQLRYAATSDEIDYIESTRTIDEKINRFEKFWEERDPTPRTRRNEAFEEYYARIAYANANFKGYTEGWRTDKGMVYIIFGKPLTVERSSPYSDGRVYERWTYGNNREFLFVDNSGFGDYRLVSPRVISDKYEYNR